MEGFVLEPIEFGEPEQVPPDPPQQAEPEPVPPIPPTQQRRPRIRRCPECGSKVLSWGGNSWWHIWKGTYELYQLED